MLHILLAITEITLGGILLAVWIAAAVLGFCTLVLRDAVHRGWITLPPPNTTFARPRNNRAGSIRPPITQVRHAYDSGHV